MNKFLMFKIKDKSAQALPEFALCLPLIMLIIGMLITVAQLVYAKQVCQAAAQASCRYYASPNEDGGVNSYFPDWLNALMNPGSSVNINEVEKAREYAQLIIENADMNITLENAKQDITFVEEPLGSTGYDIVKCSVKGRIDTLFPVQWNNNTIQPNTTFITGNVAMIMEQVTIN